MNFESVKNLDIASDHPFLNQEFFSLCEDSGVTTIESGWEPVYFQTGQSFSYAYIKSHSYGEYIFDWAWADLFHRFQIPYYPKLVQALPVTPVSAPKFINPTTDFLDEIYSYYLREPLSSHHILFTEDHDFFRERNYFFQKTLQFHFINRFESYDDFLNQLKARRRKNILKERKTVKSYNLHIKEVKAIDLTHEQRLQIYHLYLSTIIKKNSQAYLSESFFLNLKLGHYLLAYKDNELIAMSFFMQNSETLFGRYWGIHPRFEAQYSKLHFEMCYYLPIEKTISQKIPKFEAGAQGEQKLLRGFEPVAIGSLHHIKHQQLGAAIKNFINQQNDAYTEEINRLKEYLPFKENL